MAAMLPIVMKSGPSIVLFQGVSLAAFVQFGLFAEILVSQAAVIFSLMYLRVGRQDFYRYLFNSTMFFITSVIAAAAYWAAGGPLTPMYGQQGTIPYIPIVVYFIVHLLVNHILIYFFRNYFIGQRERLITRSLVWEVAATSLNVPFALILIFLYNEIGLASVLYVGIPFLSVALVVRLYHSAEETKSMMKKVNKAGHELNSTLDEEAIIQTFSTWIRSIVPVDYMFIYSLHDGRLEPEHIDRFDRHSAVALDYGGGDRWSKKVVQTGDPIRFIKQNEWKSKDDDAFFPHAESLLSVPIYRQGAIAGVLTLAVKKQRMYGKEAVSIVEFLSSFLIAAIDNARYYKQAKQKSERCALTRLYNYSYFEMILEMEHERAVEQQLPLSALLIDLDHFKHVNDTYGHEAGNHVLIQVAELLQAHVPYPSVVARFGGEEFAVLLIERCQEEAALLAEELRLLLADHPFQIRESLQQDQERSVNITASIGVAGTVPEEEEEFFSLVRKADRAMYTGAKQAGRNKVAAYA